MFFTPIFHKPIRRRRGRGNIGSDGAAQMSIGSRSVELPLKSECLNDGL